MAANYVLLEKITVGAAGASSVTFNSIPQTGYTDLVVKISTRDTAGSANNGTCYLRFNGSTSGYTTKFLQGNGAAVSSQSTSSTYLLFGLWGTNDSSGNTANTFTNQEVYIPNYASANYKSASSDYVSEQNGTTAYMGIEAGLWSNTAAITSITFYPQTAFDAYSTFYLYGVAKLGTTPAISPYATGGDTIMTDGTYWYHAFKSSGTFTPAKGLSCDVLVVAGGGGGAGVAGGGGGAGGYQLFSTQSLTTTGYTVTIGGGGVGGSGGGGNTGLTSGSNSQFGSLTASVGGGYGGTLGAALAGATGGSGGGGSGSQIAGSATSGQGFAGGSGVPNAGGGGGGSGAVGGASPAATVGGPGGAGKNSESSWLSATGMGVSGYIAGGGGGGGNAGGAGGAAGSGGASAGTQSTNALPATANTGSGGGGGYSGGNGGAGGSGLVIVRYAV